MHGLRAFNLYDRMREPLRLGRSLAALAEAHLGAGNLAAAERHRSRAVETFDRLGVSATEWVPVLPQGTIETTGASGGRAAPARTGGE